MSPEPTTPTREEVEASANAALDECAALTDGDIKVMARWIKQHLTSEPAASVPVTREQLIPLICCAFDECPLKDAAKAKGITLDCETDQFNCRADAILALLAASTVAREAVVEEIAKRHKEADADRAEYHEVFDWCVEHGQDAHDDRTFLLTLIGAKTP